MLAKPMTRFEEQMAEKRKQLEFNFDKFKRDIVILDKKAKGQKHA